MKIQFDIQYNNDKDGYKVDQITYQDGTFIPMKGSRVYPTSEAAVIHAMVTIDACLEERRNPNFVDSAVRMFLRMIGSPSAY